MSHDTVSPRARFRLISHDAGTRLAAFVRDVRTGLSSRPKRLPCCYFYDAPGSQLFEDICEVPEYYLPRAEREILERHAPALAARFPGDVTLVELGSGNAAKTRLLIEALLARQEAVRYVPIDICRTVLEESALQLLRDYPPLDVLAIAAEYAEALPHLTTSAPGCKLILWLGSNVGNFDRSEAAAFLRRVSATMGPDDRLLVGIDLRKDRRVLERAYDDAQGVTAQFNLNLLARINRELGGRFDLGTFRHRAIYHEDLGRVEMYLDSLCDQCVRIERLDLEVRFAAGEAIHTENSYKYSPAEIAALAEGAGLRLERQWLDREQRFSENLLAASAKR
jgi:dimethylhistidine N-methyltransferase